MKESEIYEFVDLKEFKKRKNVFYAILCKVEDNHSVGSCRKYTVGGDKIIIAGKDYMTNHRIRVCPTLELPGWLKVVTFYVSDKETSDTVIINRYITSGIKHNGSS